MNTSTFKLMVNGEFVTNVQCHPATDVNAFRAFIRTFGIPLEEWDVVTFECLDRPIEAPQPFRTNPYMQVNQFAIEVQIRNLIETYGVDVVQAVVNRQLSRAS